MLNIVIKVLKYIFECLGGVLILYGYNCMLVFKKMDF